MVKPKSKQECADCRRRHTQGCIRCYGCCAKSEEECEAPSHAKKGDDDGEKDEASTTGATTKPIRLETACTLQLEFFAKLSSVNYEAFVVVADKKHWCAKCGHELSAHLVEAPTAANLPPKDARLAPGFKPEEDPQKVFRSAIKQWESGPWCSDDSDRTKKALAFIDARFHDGTTSFVHKAFTVSGGLDTSRTFELNTTEGMSVEQRCDLGRSILAIEALGHEFLQILRARARVRHFADGATTSVTRDRSGLSTEMVATEFIMKNKIDQVAGVAIPDEINWRSWEHTVFWGLWLSVCPVDRLIVASNAVVVRLGEKYRTAHPDGFWDRATHVYKWAQVNLQVDQQVRSRSATAEGPRIYLEQQNPKHFGGGRGRGRHQQAPKHFGNRQHKRDRSASVTVTEQVDGRQRFQDGQEKRARIDTSRNTTQEIPPAPYVPLRSSYAPSNPKGAAGPYVRDGGRQGGRSFIFGRGGRGRGR